MKQMNKFIKISCIIASIMLVIGGILIGIGSAMGAIGQRVVLFDKFNIDLGSNELFETEYSVIDEFDSIDISGKCADIQIVKGDEYAIEYATYSKNTSYTVENGTLVFEEKGDFGKSNYNLGWSEDNDAYIKVYVPEDKLDTVNLYTGMGDIYWDISATANTMTVESDMGDIELSKIKVTTLTLQASMGSVTISDMTIDSLEANCDMGSFEAYADITKEANIYLSMGDATVAGYLDCDMVVEDSMGDIDITSYYKMQYYDCNIEVDMGDKDIRDLGGADLKDSKETYVIDLNASMGDATMTCKDK